MWIIFTNILQVTEDIIIAVFDFDIACMSFRGILDWTLSKIGARYNPVGARFGSVSFWHK